MSPESTSAAETIATPQAGRAPLGARRILTTWWPLAASWMLMGLEGPAISAVVSRLAEPTVNLAAFGGVVFPLALLVEAPIIMMLAASTALCRDWPSYIKLRRFMNRLGFSLTVIHIIMVATPVYFFLARDVIQAPEEIIGPARIGLLIMIPWTWSIAYRRLHQGVLIRFGHSLKVGLGTGVRLCADGIVLAVGLVLGWPGIVVATCALSAGVLIEALYVHLTVQPTLKYELKPSPPAPVPLTTRAMLDFYIPLSLTQLFLLIATPLASAAMSRMPMAIESLAAWPVVAGVMFITRGFGGAYNEVVVTYVERPRTTSPLRRFALVLVVVSSASLLVLAIPPVAEAVFAGLLNLSEPLPAMVWTSLFLMLPMPALAVIQSYFQGVVLYSRRTRSITESVSIFLVVVTAALVTGVLWGGAIGLYVAVAAWTAGELLRTLWLWWRSGPARRRLGARDSLQTTTQP